MSDANQGTRRLLKHIDEKSSSTVYIAEANVEAVRKRDKKVKLVMLPDLEEIGWVRVYMLNANGNYSSGILPEVDTTVLLLFPRGQRDMAVCLAGGLLEGSELGSDLDGDHDIKFADKYGNKISMQSGKIKIEGTIIEINGGTFPVARIGDTIASPFGPLLITSGNDTFLA